jgi:hypothetical protein
MGHTSPAERDNLSSRARRSASELNQQSDASMHKATHGDVLKFGCAAPVLLCMMGCLKYGTRLLM